MELDTVTDDGTLQAAREPRGIAPLEVDQGPGWYESSHELQSGLWVWEIASGLEVDDPASRAIDAIDAMEA